MTHQRPPNITKTSDYHHKTTTKEPKNHHKNNHKLTTKPPQNHHKNHHKATSQPPTATHIHHPPQSTSQWRHPVPRPDTLRWANLRHPWVVSRRSYSGPCRCPSRPMDPEALMACLEVGWGWLGNGKVVWV